jgi:hypothetical protein
MELSLIMKPLRMSMSVSTLAVAGVATSVDGLTPAMA